MSKPNFQLPLELQLLIARSAFDSNVRDNLLFNTEEIIKRHGINLDELPTLEIVDYSIDVDGGLNVDKYIVVLPEFVSSVSPASSIKKVSQVTNPELSAGPAGVALAAVEAEAVVTTTTSIEEVEIQTTVAQTAEVASSVFVAAEAVIVAT